MPNNDQNGSNGGTKNNSGAGSREKKTNDKRHFGGLSEAAESSQSAESGQSGSSGGSSSASGEGGSEGENTEDS